MTHEHSRWRDFLAAVRFLTRVPVSTASDTPFTAAALMYCPLVAALIGAAAAGVLWLTSHVWPMGIAVLVTIALEALATGALHEDALADCCDALGGGWTRDDVLRILEDSRIGAFGALGLGLAVALKATALASMPVWLAMPAIVASATLGRWAMVPAVILCPPLEGRSSLAEPLDRASMRRVAPWAALLTVPGVLPLAWLSPIHLLMAIVALTLVAYLFVRTIRRRLGGMTGDCLGCLCMIVQVVVLLACATYLPS
jgi:adenosylcobinamide-GDP ribazoletransferase